MVAGVCYTHHTAEKSPCRGPSVSRPNAYRAMIIRSGDRGGVGSVAGGTVAEMEGWVKGWTDGRPTSRPLLGFSVAPASYSEAGLPFMLASPSRDSRKCVSLCPADGSGSPGDADWGAIICRRTDLGQGL